MVGLRRAAVLLALVVLPLTGCWDWSLWNRDVPGDGDTPSEVPPEADGAPDGDADADADADAGADTDGEEDAGAQADADADADGDEDADTDADADGDGDGDAGDQVDAPEIDRADVEPDGSEVRPEDDGGPEEDTTEEVVRDGEHEADGPADRGDDAEPEDAALDATSEGDADAAEAGPECGNSIVELPEECDDGNDEAGDGCEGTCRYSCHSAADCDDMIWCTTDACETGGTGRVCTHDVGAGYCAIGGTCHAEGLGRPDNACEWCLPASSATSWSARPDFSPCSVVTSPDRSYDICVAGMCVSPGCGDDSCNTPGPHWPVPDTGQRQCYDLGTAVGCPGSPGAPDCDTTDFCGQDAQYGWDIEHPSGDRFTRGEPVIGQPVVTDNVTGLVWQGCAAGAAGPTCGTDTATSASWWDLVAYCDASTWASLTDWRLPDRYELMSILSYGSTGTAKIDPSAFPETPAVEFWSSSSVAGSPVAAWTVCFALGRSDNHSKGDPHVARCVRGGGGPWPDAGRFSRVAGDEPVVVDGVTGLVWQGCCLGVSGTSCGSGSCAWSTWQEALAGCQALSWAGQVDWRLPDLDELASIRHERPTGGACIDPVAFPSTWSTTFWTSTSVAYGSANAWVVNFMNGGVYNTVSKTGRFALRCVRGGP